MSDGIEKFAKRIKAKYPEYAEVDDFELAERVIRKYPEYASRVDLPKDFRLLKASSGYKKLDDLYEQIGREEGIDPNLLFFQGKQETGFKPDVFYGKRSSPKGAVGAGQFMPGTAPRYGVTDRTDPIQSIHGQAKYMKKLLADFDGDEALALAGYNAGEHRRSLREGRIPKIKETQDYVRIITDNLKKARQQKTQSLREMSGAAASPPPTYPTAPTLQTPVQPVPESFATLEAQLVSARDAGSPRTAVLFPDRSTLRLFDPNALADFERVERPEGILLVNPAKAPDYAERSTASLIGKVEDVGNQTATGAALRTEDAQGRELATSIVSPPNIQAQAAVDRAQFPQAANQAVMSAQEAVQKRIAESGTPPINPNEQIVTSQADRADQPDIRKQYNEWLGYSGKTDSPESVAEFNAHMQDSVNAVNEQNAQRNKILADNAKAAAFAGSQPQNPPASQPSSKQAYKDFTEPVSFRDKPQNITEEAWVYRNVIPRLVTHSGLPAEALEAEIMAKKPTIGNEVAQSSNIRANLDKSGNLATYFDANFFRDVERRIEKNKEILRKVVASGQEITPALVERLNKEGISIPEIQKATGGLDENFTLDNEYRDARTQGQENRQKFTDLAAQYKKQGDPSSIAQIKASKDVGWMDATSASIQLELEKAAIERLKQENPPTGYSIVGGNPIEPMFNAEVVEDQSYNINNLLEKHGTARKVIGERERFMKEYDPNTRPLARPLEFAKGFYSAVPQAASAILKTVDIVRELAPTNPYDLYRVLSGRAFKADEGYAFKAAKYIDSVTEQILPQNPDLSDYYQAGNVLGQVGVQMGVGILTGGLATPVALGSALGASEQYEEANRLGASDWQRKGASLIGGVMAVSDAIPFAKFLSPLTKTQKMGFLSRYLNSLFINAAKEVSEKEAQAIAKGAFRSMIDNVRRNSGKVATGVSLEGGQELTEKKGNDLFASLTYDPKRKVFVFTNEDAATLLFGALGGAGGGGAQIALERSIGNRIQSQVDQDLGILGQKPLTSSDGSVSPALPSQITVGQPVAIQGKGEGVIKADRGKNWLVDFNPKVNKQGETVYQSTAEVRKDQVEATTNETKAEISQPAAQVDEKPVLPSAEAAPAEDVTDKAVRGLTITPYKPAAKEARVSITEDAHEAATSPKGAGDAESREIADNTLATEPMAKENFQLTREEFEAKFPDEKDGQDVTAIDGNKYRINQGSKGKWFIKAAESGRTRVFRNKQEMREFLHGDPTHKKAVGRAVREGKTVEPSVLKNYPQIERTVNKESADRVFKFQSDERASEIFADVAAKGKTDGGVSAALRELPAIAEKFDVSESEVEKLVNNADTAFRRRKERGTGVREEGSRPPAGKTLRGKQVRVDIAGSDKSYNAEYELREADDVHPSHNPFNFNPNEEYFFKNDRHYDKGGEYAANVIERSMPNRFKPSEIVNNAPTAELGAPVIDIDGNILGGNSRGMMVKRIFASENLKARDAYLAKLRDDASTFGFSVEDIGKFNHPVLVRKVTDRGYDKQTAITDLNKVSVTTLTQSEQAIAEGGNLTPDALDYIVSKIKLAGQDASLSDILNRYGDDIVTHLIKENIFSQGERNSLLKDGEITQPGKDRITKMLAGHVFEDLEQMQFLPDSYRNALQKAVIPLIKTEKNEDWNLISETREAIDLLTEHNAKAARSPIDEFVKQVSTVKPEGWSREATAIAKTIKTGVSETARAFNTYAGEFRNADEGSMFGALSPEYAFAEAFNTKNKNQVTPEMADTFVTQGQSLFKIRTDESSNLLMNVLPKLKDPQRIFEGLTGGKFNSDDDLELSEYDAEMVRRLMERAESKTTGKSVYQQVFEGIVFYDDAIENIVAEGRDVSVELAEANYPDQLIATFDKLLNNLEELNTRNKGVAVAYVFDDALPEEKFHQEDIRAGRTDRKAIAELKKNPIWNFGGKFDKNYGDRSDADKTSEIAAKLATNQESVYGWDEIENFAEEKKKFMVTWAAGIMRKHTDADGNLNFDFEKFKRIAEYAYLTPDYQRRIGSPPNEKTGGGRPDGISSELRERARSDDQGASDAEAESTPGGSGNNALQAESLNAEQDEADLFDSSPSEVRAKNRQFAVTLRENGRDATDVPYIPGTDTERIEEAKKILQESRDMADNAVFPYGDYEHAIDIFESPETDGRTKTVLGIALIDHLGAAGEYTQMLRIAQMVTNHVGEAAQALQAATIVSKYDFAGGIRLAQKALKKHRKTLTDNDIEAIRDLTEEYATSERERAVLEFAAKEAEAVIKQLQTENAEIAEALGEQAAEIAEKDTLITNLKRQIERWKNSKMSRSQIAAKVSKTHRELLDRKAAIIANLREKFPTKAAVLKSTADPAGEDVTSANFDDETRKNLVEFTALQIFESVPFEETIKTLEGLTKGVLNEDEIRSIHADAVSMTRGDAVTPSAEILTRRKIRSEHRKQANAYRNVKAKNGSRLFKNPNLNRLEREILNLSGGDGQVGTASVLLNQVKNRNDWYKTIGQFFPAMSAKQKDELFIKARRLRNEARNSLDKTRAENLRNIKLNEKEFEQLKFQKRVAQGIAKRKRGTLDAHFRKLQKSKGEKAVDVAFDVFSLPKSLMSTGEVSYILRQGFLPLTLFTKDAGKGLEGVLRGLQSEENRLVYQERLREHPRFNESQVYGVEYGEISDSPVIDEHFISRLFEKGEKSGIPVVSQISKIQRKFEFAYMLPADAQRLFIFDSLSRIVDEQTGLTNQERDNAKRFAGKIANRFTGRGDVRGIFNPSGLFGKFLTALGFSPRFVASRFQSGFWLSPVSLPFAPKGMRMTLAKKQVRFNASMLMIGALFALLLDAPDDDDERSPWDVFDPASKHFMKGRIRGTDHKVDLPANMSEPMRLFFANAVGSGYYAATGQWTKLNDIWKQEWDRYIVTEQGTPFRFFRGKLSPSASFIVDAATGKDFIGRDFDPWTGARSKVWPLTYQQAYDALLYDPYESIMREPIKDISQAEWERLKAGKVDWRKFLAILIPSAVGLNVQQYAENEQSRAEQKAWDMWERKYPDKRTETQKRVESGIRKLFRMRQAMESDNADLSAIDQAIRKYSAKYNIPASKLGDIKSQATGSRFKFVTKDFTDEQVQVLIDEYTTAKERPELEKILAAKKQKANKQLSKKR